MTQIEGFVGCLAAAFLMCWVATSPKVVGAAATERQLPISFGAAWGDGGVQQS